MMDIAVQDTNLAFDNIDKTIQALTNIGYDNINSFGIIPFTNIINFTNPITTPTILLGGTKMVKLWTRGNLPELCHIFYDPIKFDQSYYSSILKQHLY